MTITSPAGRVSKFSPQEVLGQVAKGTKKPAPGLSGAWRSVFSALFRAAEGDLLGQTLRHFYSIEEHHKAKLVLPLYDGIIIGALEEKADFAARALKLCAETAAKELGLPGLGFTVERKDGP